ncbi:MAG: ABC transporter substrate-binding protein [Thermomicrobiaceae bacterium]|nr:ABC transporter substrate-binding protein [Thermomicrobiaceae bacterium]
MARARMLYACDEEERLEVKRYRRVILLALLLLAILVACGPIGGSGGSKVSLALDWYPNSDHAGIFMAKERGYFKDEGLDPKIYTPANPDDVLKLVGTGKDTFGISYQTDVLQARAQGIPVRAIAALVQHPLNTVMALKESGITRPKDLEGKKVGTPGIPSDEALLATMLEADGSSLDKVQLVNVGYDLVPALIGKKVDAIIGGYETHEAILAEQQGHPVNVMRVEQWGVPDYYELVLVASDSTIEKQPELVQKFVRAITKGYQAAMADHKAALDVLVKEYPETDRKMEEVGIERLAPLWTAGAPAFGWMDAQRWQRYEQWMEQRKLLDKPVDPNSAFTDQFIVKSKG